MKLLKWTLFLAGLIIFISGCQTNPNTPEQSSVDTTLPKVENVKTISDINAIGFEWSPVRDSRVEGYYIYRTDNKESSQFLKKIATIDDKHISHYVDTKLEPNTNYSYRMSSFSNTKQESEPSEVVSVATLANIESVPYLTAISDLPNRTKLIWRPHPSLRVSSYIIEKSAITSDKWSHLATIEGRLNAEYIDKGLKDGRAYKYRVKVKTYDGLISNPSQVVEVQTKALPLIIENLSATQNLPKKIILTWSVSTQNDVQYYKIYRASNPSVFYSYHAKTGDNSFEDLLNDNGVARYYYVTAVDKDGLESPRQQAPAMGTTIAVPDAPIINVVKSDSKNIMIGWNDTAKRAKKFQVTKKFNGESVTFTNINTNSFIDNDVLIGTTYTYTVYGIDEYGLTSKASENIVITIPKD